MSREATTGTPRIAGRLTGRHLQGQCDHGVVLTTTCDDCRLALRPAPDTGGEWRVVHDGPSRPMIETSDSRLLSLSQFEGGRWISYEQEETDIAQVVTDHNRIAKLEAILRRVTKSRRFTPEVLAEIDAALSLPVTATGDTEGEME